MIELINIFISTILITIIAFIGIFTLALKDSILNKILLILVSLSAGALMGGAFLHLIPESIEISNDSDIFIFVLLGFKKIIRHPTHIHSFLQFT